MAKKLFAVVAPVMLASALFLAACSHPGGGVEGSAGADTALDPMRGGGTVPGEGDRLDQWTVNAIAPAVDTEYSLANSAHGAVLFYATNPNNNLEWDGNSHNEWSFRKTSASQFLAIYNKRADRYLVAGSTVVVWTSVPTYQWSWSDGTGNRIALYNAVKQDYLMSDVHSVPFGQVNWKFHPVPVPIIHDATVTMTAQPPVQGYVPFLGSFGGGAGNHGDLVEVRNPQQLNVPLFFVMPGHTSNECDQAGATIYLASGAALTPQDMTTLWGAPKPSLGNQLALLACAATNQSTVMVNVKYTDS
jgi:hypothetical protein